jgi:hypothetical protein
MCKKCSDVCPWGPGNRILLGDTIRTPRFGEVAILAVFLSEEEARLSGYTETTHYSDAEYDIRGKHTGENKMQFAAIEKYDRSKDWVLKKLHQEEQSIQKESKPETYIINIQECYTKSVEIKAGSAKEALKKAVGMYREDEIVVTYEDINYDATKMGVMDTNYNKLIPEDYIDGIEA